MRFHSCLSIVLACALALPAMAAEKKPAAEKEKPAQTVLKKKAEENTPLKKWIDAENALIDPLSDKNKESFFILRNKHSVIRVIRVVERDIENAVQACSKKNPDIKDKMNGRFKQWQGAVDPILDTAAKQLKKDVANQKIVDPDKAREVFVLNDKAYEYGESKITKTPVTSKDACEDLIDSMDRTEDNMIALLQQTLLPESVIRDRSAKEDAAERDAKAKKAPTKKD